MPCSLTSIHVVFSDQLQKLFSRMCFLIFLLADLLQHQSDCFVFMYRGIPSAVMFYAQVARKSILITDLPHPLSKVYMMLFYRLYSVIVLQYHAKITSFVLSVLQYAWRFPVLLLFLSAHFAFCKLQTIIITASHTAPSFRPLLPGP